MGCLLCQLLALLSCITAAHHERRLRTCLPLRLQYGGMRFVQQDVELAADEHESDSAAATDAGRARRSCRMWAWPR